MDITLYLLAVFAVTYLLTDQDVATSHLWQFIVTLVALVLKYLGFFWLLEFLEDRASAWYLNLTRIELGVFNLERSWSDKFLTLYSCYLCTGMWAGLILSYVLDVSLYSDTRSGHILTAVVATVSIFFLRELWNKIVYIKI